MGKIGVRIGLGIVGVVAALVLILVAIIAFDTNFGVEAATVTNVTYAGSDGTPLQGYLARPAGEGPFPAVLMVHEWWGLTAEIPPLADALAAQGYVVLAPDVYRNRVATTVPGALWMRLTTPDTPIWADTDAALAYVRGVDGVDATRVASVGFCFGGEQSLQLGLRRPQDLTAVVVFYGSLVTDPAQLHPLQAAQPVLGIFGGDDASIPQSEVDAFEAALGAAGIEHEITVYDGVGHAFLTGENYETAGASSQAWQQLIAFLDKHVKE